MVRKKDQFPLVADDELVIATAPQMQLYDNEDLINNIHGDYHDKSYSDNYVMGEQSASSAGRAYAQGRVAEREKAKSYAELAREEARQDLKRKRQTYIAQESKIPAKPNFQRREFTDKAPASKPTIFFNGKTADTSKESPVNELARFSHNLHQDHYILAELPKTYQKPKNPSNRQAKKNNYDFLKRSQIYNQEETRQRRTHQIAKELNLMLDGE
ncbi:hypothetical protein ACVR1G_08560 [Streptococcus dentasini]